MNKLFCCLLMLLPYFSSLAQQQKLQAKGIAPNRQQAIEIALSNALMQVTTTYVMPNTGAQNNNMQNKTLLQHAIATQALAVITQYEIENETFYNNLYEISLNATISQPTIAQKAAILEQYIGGIRFLVLYDARNIPANLLPHYEMAYERFNEKLIESGLRYVEKSRFDGLKAEAAQIFGNDTSELTYVQKLGLFADAQFIIFIKAIALRCQIKANNFKDTKIVIEAKAYDNCTAEGLGTVIMESDWKLLSPKMDELHLCFSSALQKGYDRLMMLFYQRVGSWVNGAPFELRFYGLGGARNLRELITLLQKNPDFGGTLEPVMCNDYIRINCNFRQKPYHLYNTILDYADSIPYLKAKQIDALWQYGRQISFAPKDTLAKDAVQYNKYKK